MVHFPTVRAAVTPACSNSKDAARVAASATGWERSVRVWDLCLTMLCVCPQSFPLRAAQRPQGYFASRQVTLVTFPWPFPHCSKLCLVSICWQERLWEAAWLCVTAASRNSTSTPNLPEYSELPPAVDVSLHLANRAHGAPHGDTEVRANGPLLGRNWLGAEASQKPRSSQTNVNRIPDQVLFCAWQAAAS